MIGGGSIGGHIGTGIVFGLIDQFSAPAERIKSQFRSLDAQVDRSARMIEKGTRMMNQAFAGMALSAAIVTPLLLGVGTAAKLEDQMANVRKTTGLTVDEANDLKAALFSLNTRTGISDLLNISEIGGQLGIAKRDILGFTDAVDKVNVALGDQFGNDAEAVAGTMGKLRNVLIDIKTANVDQDLLSLGNAINALAASGFATGPVVSDFASRIGAVAVPMKATSGQILGLSAALQELNIRSEAGGSAVSRALQQMLTNTDTFARIAGMSVRDFEQLLNDDIMEGFFKVVEGSRNFGENSTQLANILNELGLDGVRTAEVFLKMGTSMDLVREKIDLANGSLGNTDSIMAEVNAKNSTFQALLDTTAKTFTKLADVIGTALIPILRPLVQAFEFLVNVFSLIADSVIGRVVIQLTFAFGALVGVMSAAHFLKGAWVALLGKLQIMMATLIPTNIALTFAFHGVAAGLRAVATAAWAAMAPFLPIIAVVAAVAAGVYALVYAWRSFNDVLNGTKEPAKGILGFFQRVGGVLHGVVAIWRSATEEGFSLSNRMRDALERMGILENVIALGTWITRIKHYFRGVWEGVKPVFDALKEAWNQISSAFGELFDIISFEIFGKAAGSMDLWHTVGKAIGTYMQYTLIPVIKVLSWLIQGLIWVFKQVAHAIGWVIDKIKSLWNWITGLWDKFTNLKKSLVEIGVGMIQSIGKGIRSAKDWLFNILLDVVRALPFGDKILSAFGIEAGTTMVNGQMVPEEGGILPPGNEQTDGLGRQIAVNRQLELAAAQPVVFDRSTQTEVVRNIRVDIDGQEIRSRIQEEDEYDNSRS